MNCMTSITKLLGFAGAILCLALPPTVAKATVVEYTFIAPIIGGPAGQFGTGTFSYDDTGLNSNEVVDPPNLHITFDFDGQTFTEINESGWSDGFPELRLADFVPVFIDFLLEDGKSGVDFNNSNIRKMHLYGDLVSLSVLSAASSDELLAAAIVGPYDFEVPLTVTYYSPPVPIPAAVWLFGSGLIGMIGLARRKKHND